MRKLNMFLKGKPKRKYTPEPYKQMTDAGERVHVDAKVAPNSVLPIQNRSWFNARPVMCSQGRTSYMCTRNSAPIHLPISLSELCFGTSGKGSRSSVFKQITSSFTKRFSKCIRDSPTLLDAVPAREGIQHKLSGPIHLTQRQGGS